MNYRYDDASDAIPYESTVLVLSEVETVFGQEYVELFDAVREDVDCERQHVEEHHRTLEDLPDFETIVQYDVWLVHYRCLLLEETTESLPHLASKSLPEETQVVVAIDTDDDVLAEYLHGQIQSAYGDQLTIVTSEAALRYFLLGHLKTASPCSAAGLEYILSRNNTIADRIGHPQDEPPDPP